MIRTGSSGSKSVIESATIQAFGCTTVIKQEGLDQYVRRVLKEKGLTVADVQRRAGGEISKGYVCDISNGKVRSLTVHKLKALARGLGVLEEEIFAVARGAAPPNSGEFDESAFAMVFFKYRDLSEEDKKEVAILLEAVEREVERRRSRSRELFFSATTTAEAREERVPLAEVDWTQEACSLCGGA